MHIFKRFNEYAVEYRIFGTDGSDKAIYRFSNRF